MNQHIAEQIAVSAITTLLVLAVLGVAVRITWAAAKRSARRTPRVDHVAEAFADTLRPGS